MGKFKNLKANLKEDAKKAFKEKESGGFRTEQYLDINMFDEASLFHPMLGKNAIDVIPFIHETDLFKAQGKGKGDPNIMLDVYVHKGFNQRFSKCACLRRMFGKPCAICEERDRLREADETKYKEEIRRLKPKHRTIMNVINLKENEDDDHNGQIQIFDESQWFFMKELLEEAEANVEEHGDAVDFYSPDEGQTVLFRTKKNPSYPRSFVYRGFNFEKRDETYNEGILEHTYKDAEFDYGAFPLDAMLKIHTYAEQEAMLNEEAEAATDEKDEKEYEEKTQHKGRRRKARVETTDTDDVEKKPEPEVEVEPEPEVEVVEDDTPTCPFGKTYGVDGSTKDETCLKCKKADADLFMNCIVDSLG